MKGYSLTESIGRGTRVWGRSYDLCTSQALWLVKSYHISTAVSRLISFHSDIRTNGWLVVKQRSKDKYFDEEDGSEESDCEIWLDQVGYSVVETKVGIKEESGQDPLPILSVGSLTR